MRVLVCGGRDYDDWGKVCDTLLNITRSKPYVTIIEGGARGADRLGRRFALEMEYTYITYPADWEKYGRGAGHIRNQQMLDEGKPDLVVAFPGGRGTANMIERAKKAGVEVIQVE